MPALQVQPAVPSGSSPPGSGDAEAGEPEGADAQVVQASAGPRGSALQHRGPGPYRCAVRSRLLDRILLVLASFAAGMLCAFATALPTPGLSQNPLTTSPGPVGTVPEKVPSSARPTTTTPAAGAAAGTTAAAAATTRAVAAAAAVTTAAAAAATPAAAAAVTTAAAAAAAAKPAAAATTAAAVPTAAAVAVTPAAAAATTAAALAASTEANQTAHGCTIKKSTEIRGPSHRIFEGVPDAASCAVLCRADPQCRDFVYGKREGHKHHRKCALKAGKRPWRGESDDWDAGSCPQGGGLQGGGPQSGGPQGGGPQGRGPQGGGPQVGGPQGGGPQRQGGNPQGGGSQGGGPQGRDPQGGGPLRDCEQRPTQKLIVNSHVKYGQPLESLYRSLLNVKFQAGCPRFRNVVTVLGGAAADSEPQRAPGMWGDLGVTVINVTLNSFDLHGLSAVHRYIDHPLVQAGSYFYVLDTVVFGGRFPQMFDHFATMVQEDEVHLPVAPNSNIFVFGQKVARRYKTAYDRNTTKEEGLYLEHDWNCTSPRHITHFANRTVLLNKRKKVGQEDVYHTGFARTKYWYPDFDLYKYIMLDYSGDLTEGKLTRNPKLMLSKARKLGP